MYITVLCSMNLTEVKTFLGAVTECRRADLGQRNLLVTGVRSRSPQGIPSLRKQNLALDRCLEINGHEDCSALRPRQDRRRLSWHEACT